MKRLILILLFILPIFTIGQVVKKEIVVNGLNAKPQSSTPEKTLKKEEIDSLNNFAETGFFLRNFANNVTTTSDGSGQVGYNYYKIRGIDNPRLNFTLNGAPINDQLDGWTFLSNMPDFLNNVGEVQVQYGVGTSSYGLAPVGGSVHFKTTTPLDSQNTTLEYSLGSFGFNRYSVSNNTGLIKGRFKFTNRFSNMYTKGFRENSEFQGKTFFSSGGYYGEKTQVTYTFMTGDIRSQMAYLGSSLSDIDKNYRHNPLTKQWDDFNQTLFMVNSKHRGDNWVNESAVYVNGVYGNFEVAPDTTQLPPFMKVFTNGTNIGAYSINTFTVGNNSLLKLGTNVIHTNRIQSLEFLTSEFYSNRNTKTQFSQFVKYELNAADFDFYVDLETRYVNMGYRDVTNDITHNKYWVFLNPKFGVTKNMGKFVSYASFAQVTREPYRLDMLSGHDDVNNYNGDTIINQTFSMSNVSPERINDYEAGLRYFDDGFTASVNLYHMDFQNEIVPIGVISNFTSLPVRQNVGR
jgi:iron complex outermembrane receptor protein